jgi:hypothetical protein
MDSQRVAQQVWAAIGGRIQDRVTGPIRKNLDGRIQLRLWPQGAWDDRLDLITDRVLLQAKEDYQWTAHSRIGRRSVRR